jgi:hypothetical protein
MQNAHDFMPANPAGPKRKMPLAAKRGALMRRLSWCDQAM